MSIFSSFKPNELASFVKAITKQEIANSEQKFEQVLIGTIKSVDSNKYTVALKDTESEVEATALNGTDVFSKEDSIYLLRCTFDNNTNYLILNTVAVTEEIYFNLPLESRFIASMEIENYSNVETIKANGVLKVGATFSANGATENYGLEINLLDSSNKILITYYLDTNYFEGQPYALNESLQSRVIYIEDKDILKNLNSIVIEEFPKNSFHVKDGSICLYSGTIIEADPSLHAEAVVVGNKNYFNKIIENQEDNEIIKVSADLFHNSTRLQKSTIQYYWLLKNENIKENQIGENTNAYLAIAGSGWECLNSFEVLSVLGGGLYRNWNTTQQTLELNSNYRDKLNKFRNILKCLIVYGDNYLYSKEFEILNYEHEEFYANVIKDQESDYLEDSENANIVMTCKVLDRNIENSKIDLASKYTIEYQWYKGEPQYDEDKNLENDSIEGKTKQTLTVYRNNAVIADSVDAALYIKLDSIDSIATFFCEVKIYNDKEKTELLSTEVSNFITIIPIIQGNEGKSIKAIKEFYLASDKDTGVTTVITGWEEEISKLNPAWGEDAKYLWNYETSYYDEGGTDEAYSTDPIIIAVYAKDGDPGRGIVSITNYYLNNNNSQSIPNRWSDDDKTKISTDSEKTIDSGWKTAPTPTDSTNKYLWNFEKIIYSNSFKYEYTVPALIGAQGSDGTGVNIKGSARIQNNAIPEIGKKYVLYQDVENGALISIAKEGDSYLVKGFLMVYTGGENDKGNPLFNCAGTIQGPQGKSVSSIIEYYAWNNDDSKWPSRGTTDSNTNIDTTTQNTQWQKDTPPLNENNYKYLWNYEESKDIDDNILSTTNPIVVYRVSTDGTDGTNGIDGDSFAGIENYYIWYHSKENAPPKPSLSNGTVTNLNGWTETDSPFNEDIEAELKPYKWGCEAVKIKISNGSIESIVEITKPKLIYEQPKTQWFIYSVNDSKPNNPTEDNIGENKIWSEEWPETTNENIWACTKFDLIFSGGGWSNPYLVQAKNGQSGRGIQFQEELYTKSTSSTTPNWGENQIIEWYSKEDFFARGVKTGENDKGYSLYTGHWDDADDIENYPYIWKKIRTTYDVDTTGTGMNDTADSTPLLLSDLEAATLAAAAQIQDKGDYSSIVGAWCAAVGKTIVDGSTIMTGTVGADQIQVNSLDALTANMGSLTAGEIKSPDYGTMIKIWGTDSLIPIEDSLFSIEETPASAFNYTNDGSSVTITEYIGDYTDVVIPSTIDGLPVTSIGEAAFWGMGRLKSITIGKNVVHIGRIAFQGCTGLELIIVPNQVISMDGGVFYNCYNLTIYCEAESQPSGWADNWNSSDRPVYWYSEEQKEGNYWHYDKEGFKISCDDENMIDSKYFAVTKNGEVTAMEGKIAGWDITSQGLSRENTEKGLKYGLNSNPDLVAPSLISEGETSQVIFYCQNNGEMTFQILADGSLYVTAARFSGSNVILNDDVMLADVPASDLLSAAGLLSVD